MIEQAFIIAFAVFFLHATTWDGMVNHWAERVAYKWPNWVKKPLFSCPICMCPWYGALFFLLGLFHASNWAEAALTVAAAGGLNAALVFFVPFGSQDEE